MQWILVALGGALGAVSRFGLGKIALAALGQGFPWGTWVANLSGSLLIGIMIVIIHERQWLPEASYYCFVIGFLGAFTTYSSFSLETIKMLEEGMITSALTYALSTSVLCLLLTWIGIQAARSIG